MNEKLLFTTNAKEWADEFVRMFGGDPDLMTTWFSSAIETGHGAGILQGAAMVRKQVQAAVDELKCHVTCGSDCYDGPVIDGTEAFEILADHTGITPTEVTP
jgi:hypothetical protein